MEREVATHPMTVTIITLKGNEQIHSSLNKRYLIEGKHDLAQPSKSTSDYPDSHCEESATPCDELQLEPCY